LPKTTLNKDFQKKRQENYQKDVEREKMEKEKERDREEKEKLQRENEEMKRQLSKLATVPPPSSSTLQVNKKNTITSMFCPKFSLYLTQCVAFKGYK
jgi:U3 small nucleolar ribonucleoprotein component